MDVNNQERMKSRITDDLPEGPLFISDSETESNNTEIFINQR